MSNIVYNQAKNRLATGALDLDSDTIKVIPLGVAPNGGAAENPDTDTVAAVLADATELACTGYTGGVGSTDRKTLTVTATLDDTNNRSNVSHGGATWSALSSGTHSAIAGYLIYEHVSGSDDTLNIPIQYVNASPFSSLSLNGSDVTLPSGDFVRLA